MVVDSEGVYACERIPTWPRLLHDSNLLDNLGRFDTAECADMEERVFDTGGDGECGCFVFFLFFS